MAETKAAEGSNEAPILGKEHVILLSEDYIVINKVRLMTQ